jgi:hypothetical protein
MALTQIADIDFDPDVYASYMQEDDPAKNAFIASGAVVVDPELTSRASGEADTTSIPYWNDLDNTSENISSDDPAQLATPQKIDTGKMRARRIHINNAWQTANLAKEISAQDPMMQIQSRTSNYWTNRLSRRIQGMQTGMFLENEAGTGDMIVDVSIEDGDNALAANLWSFDTFVDGYSTMGENANKLALLAVHPQVMKQMRKENNIEFIKDSETGLMIPFYNELRVVEDKRQPVIAGTTSGFRYVSTIYAAGAFGMGQALAVKPVELDSTPLAGNGAGVETLIERKQMILHPGGYDWTETTVADESPTVAECALPANWARKFLRENVAIAFIVSNG